MDALLDQTRHRGRQIREAAENGGAVDLAPLKLTGVVEHAHHPIGTTGASRHAGAPAFRELGDRIELDTFSDRLRDGLQSTHADMPSFRFSRDDARAVIAYLRALQSP
jgi:hypothetical protein